MTRKLKVVFYDNWLGGTINLVPLHERLRRLGADTLLLHTSSWKGLPADVTEVQGLPCRDISAYRNSVERALLAEAPDAVLMLTTYTTANRLVVRLCRRHGIPTIYMMHGITATGERIRESARIQNAEFSLWDRLKRVPKFARILPQYAWAVARDEPGDIPMLMRYLLRLVTRPGDELNLPRPSPDVRCDRALTYAELFRRSLIETLGYAPERVVVTGNPNLDAVLGLKNRPDAGEVAAEYRRSLGLPCARESVVYVDDAFVEQGWWTEEQRLRELEEVAAAATEAGLDVVVKLHPSAGEEPIRARFARRAQVHVVKQVDLARLMLGARAAIGHMSTALLVPAVLGVPVYLPTWSPAVAGMHFLHDTGAAREVASVDKLRAALLDGAVEGAAPVPEYERFLRDYITVSHGRGWDAAVEEILAVASGGERRTPVLAAT